MATASGLSCSSVRENSDIHLRALDYNPGAHRVHNALPDETLTFDAPSARDGSPPTASAGSVAPGNTISMLARNDDGGCVGNFTLSGSAAHGYAVPLALPNDGASNCQEFVNSLFGPNIRSADRIETSYGNKTRHGYIQPADFTGGQRAGFVDVWASQWLNGNEPRCPGNPRSAIRYHLAGSYFNLPGHATAPG